MPSLTPVPHRTDPAFPAASAHAAAAGVPTPAAALASPPAALRAGVRDALTAAPTFDRLDPEARREIAHALVRIASAANLLASEADPRPQRPRAAAMNAADELGGAALDRAVSTTRGMLAAISFPRFVTELIQGVFRAIVETNEAQLRQYVELVRGVSQSLDGFDALVGNDARAMRWLAERFPASYRIEEPDPEDVDPEDPEPPQLVPVGAPPSADALRAALGLEPGAEVPTGGPRELTAFVRRSLARNNQEVLATMVQMGMQRIVIDGGRIHAAMRFHIDASAAAEEDRRTGFDTRTSIGASAGGSFGPFSASAHASTTIGFVATKDVRTREEVNASADLSSSVELQFRTDQVPLDRIASQNTVQRLQLNTLNPERELQIAQEADAALWSRRAAAETARGSRSTLDRAGPAPAPPPLPAAGGADRRGAPGPVPAAPVPGDRAPPAGAPAAGAPAADPPAAGAPAAAAPAGAPAGGAPASGARAGGAMAGGARPRGGGEAPLEGGAQPASPGRTAAGGPAGARAPALTPVAAAPPR